MTGESVVSANNCLQQHDEHCSERRHRNTAVAESHPLLERPESDQHHAEGYRRPDEQYAVQATGDRRRPCVLALDAAEETAETVEEITRGVV